MNKIIIGIIAIAALASCADSDDNGTEISESAREIVLGAVVPSYTVAPKSKAPIATGGTFTAAVAGWQGTLTVSYADAATWKTNANITANDAPQSITLSEKQLYHSNSDTKTYIRAWYPEGTFAGGKVSFDNTDGQTDAMLVETAVVASATDAKDKTLIFKHSTTQLKFVVRGENSFTPGTELQSIIIKRVQLPNGFDFTSDPASVAYAAAADLLVPGLTTAVIIPTPTGADDVVVAAAVGSAVMINPPTGNQITLDITTSDATYTDVDAAIETEINFAAGRAHTITLTFSKFGVSLGATVDQWTSGTGSSTIN